MRTTRNSLLTALLYVSLAAACSGEPVPADPNAPAAPPASDAALGIAFEDTAIGAPPAGSSFARTGQGGPGAW
jgi:hypothetical protein